MGAKQKRNLSIDLARLICSLLVIGIHTDVLGDVSETLSAVMTQHIGRLAVPFFFVVSGYFYMTKLITGDAMRYLRHILKIYTIWSAVVSIELLLSSLANHADILESLRSLAFSYLFCGTTDTLWFFPALMYSAVMVAVAYKSNRFEALVVAGVMLFCLGCVLDTYSYLLPVDVFSGLRQQLWYNPARRIFMIGLPYVTVGGMLKWYYEKHRELVGAMSLKSLLVALVLLVAESVAVVATSGSAHISRTFLMLPFEGALFLFLLSHPMDGGLVSKYGRRWRDYATLIYLIHPIIIDVLLFASGHLLAIPINETPRFVIVCMASIGLSAILVRLPAVKRHLI